MDRLFSVADICARYQCKAATARKYMRNMEHMEAPLMVTERAVAAWERRKTVPPERETRLMLKEVKKRGVVADHAPRRRESA